MAFAAEYVGRVRAEMGDAEAAPFHAPRHEGAKRIDRRLAVADDAIGIAVDRANPSPMFLRPLRPRELRMSERNDIMHQRHEACTFRPQNRTYLIRVVQVMGRHLQIDARAAGTRHRAGSQRDQVPDHRRPSRRLILGAAIAPARRRKRQKLPYRRTVQPPIIAASRMHGGKGQPIRYPLQQFARIDIFDPVDAGRRRMEAARQ